VLWRQREFLDYGWRADVEFAYRSDRNFMPVYFKKEYEEGKSQETLLYLRKQEDNRIYTALASARVNQFDTYVERLPELGLFWLSEPLCQDRFVWTSENRLSYLNLKYDNALGLDNPHATERFDSLNELSYPFGAGFLQLDPFVELGLTGYSNKTNEHNASARAATSYGIRGGTNFYRTYAVENEWLNVHGIRHIFTPTFNYKHTFYASGEPGDYTTYDEAIDQRDELHEMNVRLRNRWQTMRGPVNARRSVDFVETDVDFYFYPGDEGMNASREDYARLNAVWRVNDNISLTSTGDEYNIEHSSLDVANLGVALTYWQPLTISYSHDYIPGREGRLESSIGTLKTTYRPQWSRWQVELEQSYDFKGEREPGVDRDAKNLGTILALTRDMHCWRVIISAELHQGVRDDKRIGVRLEPEFLTARKVEL
jgi:hypothetical protein